VDHYIYAYMVCDSGASEMRLPDITPRENIRIMELYDKGIGIATICLRLGLRQHLVHKVVKESGRMRTRKAGLGLANRRMNGVVKEPK
jgi:hypothetical protein